VDYSSGVETIVIPVVTTTTGITVGVIVGVAQQLTITLNQIAHRLNYLRDTTTNFRIWTGLYMLEWIFYKVYDRIGSSINPVENWRNPDIPHEILRPIMENSKKHSPS